VWSALAQDSSGILSTRQQSFVGSFATDAAGRTVYAFSGDPVGQSACTGACAEAWPPVLVDAGARDSVSAASLSGHPLGVITGHPLGVITRDDESLQITVDGQPLYWSTLDAQPGDMLGNGRDEFGGIWSVVSVQ
jgi:predicted lipoprotein with Yx(FWY)xxD motif